MKYKSLLLLSTLLLTSCCRPSLTNWNYYIDKMVYRSNYSMIINDVFLNDLDTSFQFIVDVSFYPDKNEKMYFYYQDFAINYYGYEGSKRVRINNKESNRDENIKNNGFDIFDNEIDSNINYKFYFDTIVVQSFRNALISKDTGKDQDSLSCLIDDYNFIISSYQIKKYN